MAEGTGENGLTVLLAVTAEDRFSKVMARKLDGPGRSVLITADLAAFRDAVEKHQPDIVVLDGGVDYAPELRQWLKGMPRRQLTSLVAFYPEEFDPRAEKGFRVLEDEMLVEPYELEELNRLIEAEAQRLGDERKYFQHEVKFQVPSQPAYVQQGGDFVERLVNNSGLEEDEALAFVNACREAMDNAARHGNNSNPDAFLHVDYVVSQSKVTLSVKDEGEGFDVNAHLGEGIEGDAVSLARERHAQGKVGGLGIMLMLRCVDKLEYNRDGNQVKLTKNLKQKVEVA